MAVLALAENIIVIKFCALPCTFGVTVLAEVTAG